MRNETAVLDSSNNLASGETEASSSTGSERLILFALWLLVFSASSQLMIIVAMLPAIGEQLAISTAKQGLLVSSYAAMVGVFALVAGPISDKIGRRRMLLLGAGLMTSALALHAVVVDYFGLLAVRTIAGIAGGALMSLTVSLGQVGFASGAALAGVIYSQAGYRAGTFVGAGIALVATFLVWRMLPEPEILK